MRYLRAISAENVNPTIITGFRKDLPSTIGECLDFSMLQLMIPGNFNVSLSIFSHQLIHNSQSAGFVTSSE